MREGRGPDRPNVQTLSCAACRAGYGGSSRRRMQIMASVEVAFQAAMVFDAQPGFFLGGEFVDATIRDPNDASALIILDPTCGYWELDAMFLPELRRRATTGQHCLRYTDPKLAAFARLFAIRMSYSACRVGVEVLDLFEAKDLWHIAMSAAPPGHTCTLLYLEEPTIDAAYEI